MPFNILTPASTAEASASFQVDVLKRFIKLAKPVIPAKTTIPVLEHIRIYTEKERDSYLLPIWNVLSVLKSMVSVRVRLTCP